MRIHLFEFEDLKWFPDVIRTGGTDFLRYLFNFLKFYQPSASIINEGLQKTGQTKIIDLCSGGGGPYEQVQQSIDSNIKIYLSDLYPNKNAFEYLKVKSNGKIDFIETAVDASNTNIPGFRTMFSAFHHFKPESAKAVLKNAVDNNAGIAVFDGGDKNIFSIIGLLLFHPLAFFFATPFFRPFKFSRIFFTYIIPLIPLYTIWDGIVSILRLYSPQELLLMADEINAKNYKWKSGKLKSKFGLSISYLIGIPLKNEKS